MIGVLFPNLFKRSLSGKVKGGILSQRCFFLKKKNLNIGYALSQPVTKPLERDDDFSLYCSQINLSTTERERGTWWWLWL